MSFTPVQDRDDAYGPRFGDGALWGAGAVALVLLNTLVASFFAAPFSAAVTVGLALAVAAVGGYFAYIASQRRLRRAVLHDGVSCDATVLAKAVEVYNGQDAAAEPFYWLTMRFTLGGTAQTVRVRVTDRVYLRARADGRVRGRVLPDRPGLWVPDGAAGEP
jgi:hypothetical protein